MLIIAHRLGTVRDFDLILELVDGALSQVVARSEVRGAAPVLLN